MSKCLTRDLNGELSLTKRKHPVVALACPHRIQFMIKDYLPQLVKLIEMHSEENSPYPQDCRCGVLENGKYVAEYTLPLTETYLKP